MFKQLVNSIIYDPRVNDSRIIFLFLNLTSITSIYFFFCSSRYRKFIKSVFDWLASVFHRQRIVSGRIYDIVHSVRPVVFRYDFYVFQITEMTHIHTRHECVKILKTILNSHWYPSEEQSQLFWISQCINITIQNINGLILLLLAVIRQYCGIIVL